MKIKHKIFCAFAIVLVAAMVSTGCKTSSPANVEGQKYIMRGDLKLVAEYKPLHLYIYAETTSTNNHPDYVILQGNEPLIFTDSKSNTVEVVFCEKNFRGQFTTTYDYKGQVLKHSYGTQNNDSVQTNYLYFDSNGDGQWDFLRIFFGANSESSWLVRSNLCWVPK